MYTVEVKHHCKAWRRGDLEDDTILEESRNFKTRTAAKEWIENKLKGKPSKQIVRDYHKGDSPSWCCWYTGNTWVNENSGETHEEAYMYILQKTKVYG